ncbi:MAG: hypothetical protein PHF44_03705, partial [Candidatus Pacebacteria bacterium]|nr:hypothetical protein [Candidatus Paceibacterota bacterium]
MKNPEQVIYIKKIGDLRFWNKKFKRIYFGNEFCPNLIPTPKEVKIALAFATKQNLEFSLLTCQVNDYFLKKFIKIFPILREGDEIILNDWGILNVIKKRFKNLLPYCLLGKFITNNINLTIIDSRKFLKERGFSGGSLKRLEMEIGALVDQRLLNPAKTKRVFHDFKVSVYYPYSFFSVTRLCPTAYCDKAVKPKNYRSEFRCQKECQKYTFLAKHPTKNIDLILKGNTWFKKASLPYFFKKNADRLVYMPTIPV